MNIISTEELKEIQLGILDYVHQFCIDNHIKYWLDCGTLLGAVRHKGYIPWDDDVDIGMLRVDFERFRSIFEDPNGRYHFICGDNDSTFFGAHGKVLDTSTVLYEPDLNGYKSCVNIDVFVYDNAPDNDKEFKKMYDKRDLYRTCTVFQKMPGITKNDTIVRKCVKNMLHVILAFFPDGYFLRKMIDNCKKYKDISTKRVGNFTSYSRTYCSTSAFLSTTFVQFEGKEYFAPVGYDEWLKSLYGNYMKLPPAEKQVSHHEFIAFRL